MKGMKRFKMILLLMLPLLAVSCIKEGVEDLVPPTDSERSVELRLKIPASSLPSTRAVGDKKDVKIDEVDLMVFNAEGKYLYKRSGYNVVRPDDVTATFTANMNFGSGLRVYVLINSHSAIDVLLALLGNNFGGMSESEIIAHLTQSDPAALSASAGVLPMCGFLSGITINYTTASLANVNLIRSVARVDVSQAASATDFVLSSVSTYFSSSSGCIIPSTSNIDASNMATAPSLPISYTTDVKVKGLVDAEGDRSITDKIYIYENAVHLPAAAPKMNTRIVIGGKYGGSDVVSYYPVDFKVADPHDAAQRIFAPVLRNHRYTVNILSVSGKGYDTEDEASTGATLSMSTTIISWNDISEDVIFDGENYFHIERKSVILPGNKNLSRYLVTGSNVPTEDWEMSFDGVNYTNDASLSNTYFSIHKPTAAELRLKITTLQMAEDDASGNPVNNTTKLYIRVKRLVMEINITQRPDIPADWEEGGDYEWEL